MKVLLLLFPLVSLVRSSPSQLYGAPRNNGYYSVQAQPTAPPPVCTKVNETVCETVMVEECGVQSKDVCLTVQETSCEVSEEQKCVTVQSQSCETEDRQA